VQTNTETGTITHEKHSIWFPIRENDKHLPWLRTIPGNHRLF
jgi:hypothetical protein